jgi:hypothetical protein
MGLGHSPSVVVDGLVFYIDPNNPNCYPGFGNTLYNIVNTSIGGTFVGYTSNPIDNTETRSIFFDGTNDFIPIGSLGSFYTQGTISFWMKSSDITANYRNPFATNYNGSNTNVIRFEQGEGVGALKCWFGDPSGFIASLNYSAISANTWYNVVLTWNQSTTTVTGYLNGILDVANSSWIRWPTSFANVGIGLGYNSRYFKGNIGQVSIYNRVLSATEILQNYNATKKKYMPEENIVTNGLVLNIDPSKNASYSGVGNTVYDLSGFGNTGTLVNGPTLSFLNGASIFFDGSNDYVELYSTTLLKSSPFTTSFWINVDTFGSVYGSCALSQYYTVCGPVASYLGYTNTFMASIQTAAGGNAEGVVKESNFVKNRWYHYCSVYDGSATGNTERLKIFIDGVQKSLIYDATVPSTPYTVSSSLALGYPPPAYPYFNGKISNLQIYNKALSAQEISQNYNATKKRFVNALPPVRNGLVMELDAGQRSSYPGTGNTWYDLSGNSLNGTLTNGPTFAGLGATSSLVFDRTNDHILVADNSLLNTFTGMTLEVIVKYTTTNDQIFAQKANYVLGGGYTIEIYSSGIAAFCYGSSGSSYLNVAVSSYPANNIYHMLFTLSGNTQTLYINGVSVATNSGGSLPNVSGTVFKIGDRTGTFATSSYFGGNVYLTKFYNRGLSAYEVKQNFDFYRTRYNI